MIENKAKGYINAFAAVFIWSGFILISRVGGLSPLTSFDVIAIRYATCALILLPIWLAFYRVNILQPRLIFISIIGGLGYASFAFDGLKQAPASHAAVLLPGLLPIFIAFLSAIVNKEQHNLSKWFGIAVITGGVCILLALEFNETGNMGKGHFSLIGAAFCWGLLSVLIARWQITPWEVTISVAVLTCIIYLPVYLFALPKNIMNATFEDILIQAFYQGVMATIVQMIFYVKAVESIGATGVGALMALVPILSGFVAIPLLGEALNPGLVFSLLLVSGGVWFANKERVNTKTIGLLMSSSVSK